MVVATIRPFLSSCILEGKIVVGKKRVKNVDPASSFADHGAAVDDMFASVASHVMAKRGKQGELVETRSDELCVLPVPALSVRYLLQSVGWLLSRVVEVVGASASYKSTFAVEIVRWHALCNGRGAILEAEDKPTPDLRDAVLHHQTNFLQVQSCESLEAWQSTAVFYAKEFKKQCSRAGGPGKAVPLAIVVDSFSGKACAATIKKIEDKGYAERNYAIEANLIKTWLQVYPGLINGWPFSLIGVNHVKTFANETGTQRNVPGGKAIGYHESVQIELTKLGGLKDKATHSYVDINMTTYKNTYGRVGISLTVPLTFWYATDENGLQRLFARWEWWTASTLLLTGYGMSQARQAAFLPKIAPVIDMHEKSGGNQGKLYWSNRLGVASSDALPPHDFGMLLETRVDVLAELYDVLGIAHRPFFKPGIDYMGQYPGNEHIVAQAELSRQKCALRDGLPADAEVTGACNEADEIC
jgi:RecA/RadA recombinase